MYNIAQYDFYYDLRALKFIDKIYIFGSRSTGQNGERSDIDLAIDCPRANEEDWLKITETIDKADTLLKIDCVRYDNLKDIKLKDEIDKNKKLVFERKPNNHDWYEIFLDLGEALNKFELSFELKSPFLHREATIHTFEYSFELFWKLLKKILLEEGFEVNSPRSTLQQAYMSHLIDDESVWLKIMNDRNMTSHTYKQPAAKEIYEHCKSYCKIMRQNYEKIRSKYKL